MIFVTGDTHGTIDIRRLGTKKFPIGKELTRNDYVIIAGDFGILWDNSNVQRYWLNWLQEKPFTILFVDGNHENHDLLDSYEVSIWNGGKVHKIKDNVIHLMRGHVFTINGKKVFTFGGANSDDKKWRTEGISWWAREMPSDQEYQEGLANLENNNWEVDYIITHTAPTICLPAMNLYRAVPRFPNEITQYLNDLIERVTFKIWLHGHFHLDQQYYENMRAVYKDFAQIE